ncbi:hypothetical protein UFOVP861_13 [uncultured Caudovirales phage]|uniref:Uncharacterized protein n=1 Tax=uncultured Caudovirales phage TaxID=2100421 RepID=A0A6J5P8D1_9CAUD|nr:hypothetical protein UFOVP861_13 [uncultured Caudovirales phage]
MSEKSTTQETRLIRLEWWLRRQPVNASLNTKIEAAESFKKRLQAWVDSDNSAEIAPTFQFCTI